MLAESAAESALFALDFALRRQAKLPMSPKLPSTPLALGAGGGAPEDALRAGGVPSALNEAAETDAERPCGLRAADGDAEGCPPSLMYPSASTAAGLTDWTLAGALRPPLPAPHSPQPKLLLEAALLALAGMEGVKLDDETLRCAADEAIEMALAPGVDTSVSE